MALVDEINEEEKKLEELIRRRVDSLHSAEEKVRHDIEEIEREGSNNSGDSEDIYTKIIKGKL